jgi:hypothetical protein
MRTSVSPGFVNAKVGVPSYRLADAPAPPCCSSYEAATP